MKTWLKLCAGLVALAGLTPSAWAISKVPGLPAVPGAPDAAGAAAGAAGAAGGLFGFLCPSPDQLKACKDKICATPLGKLISNGLKPVSLFTGGIFGECCPTD